MALDKYAPNLSIRTTTKSPEGVDQQTYFSDTINAWAKKFSQEYDKVYAFVKDYMNTTRVATDPGVANKPEAAISTQSACDALIAKLMVEYENLVKLNAPYEKIREIKDKISQAQSSRDCTQVIKETVSVAPTTPVQQAAKIEEMKK